MEKLLTSNKANAQDVKKMIHGLLQIVNGNNSMAFGIKNSQMEFTENQQQLY